MNRLLIVSVSFVAGLLTDRLIIERPAHAQTRPSSDAQSASLSIGTATITMGMSRREALDKLSRYNVGGNDDHPIVMTSTDPRTVRVLGSLYFANDRVTGISRNWGEGQSGPEIESLRRSFWGVVTNYIPTDLPYRNYSIKTSSMNSPQGQLEGIDIRADAHHAITIQRFVTGAGEVVSTASVPPAVSVDETVF